MNIVKIDLASKNNKQNGFYLYIPIVEVNGKYFWCESIKTNRVMTVKDIEPCSLFIKREIPQQFYKANGIV